MFVWGKSRIIFFLSNTLIYGISRDGSKNFNVRTCEHVILGQLRKGARQAKNAPLIYTTKILIHMTNVYMKNIDMMFLLNHMKLICINFQNSTNE